MKVVVEILTGTMFYIQVENNATVSDLKRAIEAQEKHRYDRLILILKLVLSCIIMNEDDYPLTTYGVGDSSHIYLFFFPPPDDDGGALPHFLLNSTESIMDSQVSPITGASAQSE
ncbi:hypothetical protein Leryth_023309 [Lithospermum erythrorhizon]|uniref:Ubiquitin-like domain-containing protein n=1 Tax=Lithospermum erythrorhizon TaxID=34254 RepID=A0AAV3RWY6_LITER|nr:hypothetical protein Leryth_023309 [Lithospermum erythrorhizon]